MSKNNWKKNMINSKSRDYDFDTISGEKLESLYYPNEDSNDFKEVSLKNLNIKRTLD